MGKITDPANKNYTFGQEFDYSVWPEGSQIDLVNVPWNNDYRDIVKFSNQSALDAYINGLQPVGIKMQKLSYLKPGQNIRVNLPFNVVNRFNYLRAQNPVQPVSGSDVKKNFYYFILETKYIAPNTTELTLQLDVWQSYNFSVQFGNCYVERGHIGIANTNQMQNYGRDYLTTPEGLDIGSEYVVGYNANRKILSVAGTSLSYNVLVASTVDLTKDAGTVAAPKLNTANGSFMQFITSGASFYAWQTAAGFTQWLADNADKPWVTQGIISISITPPLADFIEVQSAWPDNPSSPMKVTGGAQKDVAYNLMSDWRNNSNIFNAGIPTAYLKLKKFFTYPYMMVELTTWQGTPVVIKPENWRSADAVIKLRANFVPPAQRLVAFPQNYNANTDSVSYHDYGEYLDLATIINGFPQTLAVNNSAVSYMASNKNSIAFSYQNADWSQQRAMGSAQASYDVQSNAIGAMSQLTNIGINAATQQTANTNQNMVRQQAVNSIAGTVGGAAGGAPGGAAGAVAGGASGAIGGAAGNINTMFQQDANNASLAISNNAAREANQTQVGQASFARDTNTDLARWAARGDYANQVAGINAKVQDAKMLQPTTSGQVGGDAFNIVNDTFEVKLRWKWLDYNHMVMIAQFWLRYGYAINRFITLPASLQVMNKFTYWKLTETYISAANVPESFKQSIRGLFEKGVTVWANPDDIGNVDINTNNPLPGVSY
jgi:hypothetical protein